MIKIGLLHHEKDPRKVKKPMLLPLWPWPKELNFFILLCVGWIWSDRRIRGYIYKDGHWREIISDFPDVIYNTGSPQKFARRRRTYARLKQQIPFTTSALGNKMSVYNRLLSSNDFRSYLIPSEPLQSFQQLNSYLQQYEKLIV